VKPAQNTKTLQTATHIFVAALRDPLPVKGSGLSRISPRALLVSVFATVLGALAFMSAPALASAPETPETLKPELETISETSATLRGVLSPKSPGELGSTYEFIYKASETKQCNGAGATPAGMALGAEAEAVLESVEGLTPQTEYAVCLVVHNQAHTAEAVGPAVTFITGPPETPEDEVSNVTGTNATLKSVLNPHHAGEPGRYRFVYGQGAGACNSLPIAVPVEEEPPFVAAGQQAEAVETTLTSLQPLTTYTFCIRTRNEAFNTVFGSPVTFTTTAAVPTVNKQSILSLTSTEALLAAEIGAGGEPTGYEVEYELGRRTPEQELPASGVSVQVRQRLTGLQPGTEYHFRFLAHNGLGSAEGVSVAFKTAAAASAGGGTGSCPNSTFSGFSVRVLDCRAAELVSPAGEVGEAYDPGGTGNPESTGHRGIEDPTTPRPFRAAAVGTTVVYLADPGLVGGDGSSAKGNGNEYFATRGPASGPDGWETSDITPPVGEFEQAGNERAYEAFSADLSVGTLFTQEPLRAGDPSPQGPSSCSVLYARTGGVAVNGYHALFTETQTPGSCGPITIPGGGPPPGQDRSLVFAGETTDHTQKLFQTPARLLAPAAEPKGFGGNLYDSVGGGLSLVNVLPNGEVEPDSTYGGPSGLKDNGSDFSDVIAADGSRAFWSSVEEGPGAAAVPVALYARENPTTPFASTVELDAAQPGATGASGKGQFWTASSGGGTVFFTDCNRLTEDSTAVASEGCQGPPIGRNDVVRTGNDLYVYEFAKPAGERLVDITVDHNPSDPLGADVQGVIGASEDGSYVYFIAGGALEAEPNGRGEAPSTRRCEQAAPGSPEQAEARGQLPAGVGCNLYVEHNDGGKWGRPRFIAALAALDGSLSAEKINAPESGAGEVAGDWLVNLGSRTAVVSPDGRHLVFESTQDLTGYDTSSIGLLDARQGGLEVFAYGSDTNRLACASCNPTEAPPTAAIQESGSAFTAYLPISSSDTFMHRWMNAQGTEVFFDTSQPLVAGDSNGTQDVYEWEAEGTPGCPTATSRYGGCVSLLSGGESSDFSFLVDADESGENVYFTHRGQLDGVGPQGEKAHLYDMRVGGGFPVTFVGCAPADCKGLPTAAAISAAPVSVTFGGVGNFTAAVPSKVVVRSLTTKQKLARALKACGKEKSKRRRATCEMQARKRYRTVRSKSRQRNTKKGRRQS
jgi:hypothetical protein